MPKKNYICYNKFFLGRNSAKKKKKSMKESSIESVHFRLNFALLKCAINKCFIGLVQVC